MARRCRTGPSLAAAAGAALGLAACGGGLSGGLGIGDGGMVAGYSAANAILPVGYSEVQVDETHWRVRAHGSQATTRERLEKIATARAAEIGVEQRLPYFKVTGVTPGIDCGKKTESYKAGSTPATIHPLLTIEVAYAKTPDAEMRPSSDTFTQLKAELDSDIPTLESKTAATQDAKSRCGIT